MLPKLTMEGRLTADPELRFLDSGLAVCSFTIVNQDRRKNDATGEWEDSGDPLFIRVSVWRQQAENAAESLSKGDLVVCIGKLQNRKWEDKEGNKKFATEVVGDNLIMLDKRSDGGSHTTIHHEGIEGIGGPDAPPIGEPSEDLPF